MRSLTLLLLLYVTSVCCSFSQDSTLVFQGNILGTASSANTPLWLNANQYGAIPAQGSFVSLQASAHKVYNPGNPRVFQWSGGAELIAIGAKKSDVFFTDLFLAGKAGPFEIGIGQRKNVIGLADTLLSSGALALSSNARPYPRYWIGTNNFVGLIPGSDFFSFLFSYSDGLLGPAVVQYGNVRHVDQIYMHHKMLYFRLGGRHTKLSLYGGFNHQAMWGGEDRIFSGGLERAEAYRYVIFGKPWGKSRVGNHFGTIDVGAEWKGNNWSVFAYRQSIYEDGSLSNLSNIADGLAGLRFKKTHPKKGSNAGFQLKTLLLEYLYTKNQGGSLFDFNTGVFGRDNYYNHYIYRQGWSYHGRTFGTPLIPPQNVVRDEVRSAPRSFTSNNRVAAVYLGANLSWEQIDFLLKASFSNNVGLYNDAIAPAVNQCNFLIRSEIPTALVGGSHFSLTLAADYGKLFPVNHSLMIGWRKAGFFK